MKKETVKNHFHKYVRLRDQYKGCISCGGPVQQAGHLYKAEIFRRLEFEEDNVNGQCVHCNYYLSGNENQYRKNLINRIGLKRVEALDILADSNRKNGFTQWTNEELKSMSAKYREKLKKLKP